MRHYYFSALMSTQAWQPCSSAMDTKRSPLCERTLIDAWYSRSRSNLASTFRCQRKHEFQWEPIAASLRGDLETEQERKK